MRVTLVRSGGFAGLRRTTAIDGAALGPADADALRALVDGARFFALPAAMPAPQPDRFQYRLTVEEGGRSHTVVVDEAALGAELGALVRWLEARAHP